MTYPFVQAANDYGPLQGPVKAFVIHMAEGGGTVGYLSRPNPRGVSVHYVIEYSGRIVQMLREDHASGSINPQEIRTTEGPAPYGASSARACLGLWMRDPNSAVLSCEIEGFAADGPNAKQDAALVSLVADIRTRHHDICLLGHRDFQDYKPCPGAHIPWDRLGGHGPKEDDPMSIYTRTAQTGSFTVPADTEVRAWKATASGFAIAKTWTPRPDPSTGRYVATLARLAGTTTPSSLLEAKGGFFDGLYVSTADVTNETPDAPLPVDTKAAFNQGVAAAAAAALSAQQA